MKTTAQNKPIKINLINNIVKNKTYNLAPVLEQHS